MVHGGGPVIARREEDIYSHHGISFLQGVVLVQTHIRMFLDRKKRLNLYDEKLSERQAAKSVIIKTYLEDISVRAEEIISKEQVLTYLLGSFTHLLTQLTYLLTYLLSHSRRMKEREPSY